MKLLKIRTTRQESSNSVISLESSSNHSARTTGSRSSSSSARKSAGSILILGLDGAGKTTILYRFALNQSVDTLPTLTSNKETVALESETLGGENTWDLVDVGGSPALRHTWSTYARAVDGIIYVVDSTAEDRLSEAGHCLRRLYHREPLTLDDLASSSVESDNTDFNRALSATKSLTHAPSSTPCATLDVPLLLIVNKKDSPGAVKPGKVLKALGLREMGIKQAMPIQCEGRTGDGVEAGLKWLTDVVLFNRSEAKPKANAAGRPIVPPRLKAKLGLVKAD
mmetsp:Transcript_2371/g.6323  ORF Transcript_2371/g.6323 Transcript_2371/m.6323 type:complete len:282 (+) Transcript_2371:245-1090(+)